MPKQIRLNVDAPGAEKLATLPITQGIPFPDEELERGAPVRVVNSDGHRLPTQYTCLATWNSDLKYVKWLLIDFQPPDTQDVFLEYGNGVEPELPSCPVTVQDEASLLVSTGALELEFARGDPDFLKAVRVKSGDSWRDMLGDKDGLALYMADSRGLSFSSGKAAPAPAITIEDSGPMRASLCIKGFHASEDARVFCPYILRIHAFAGRSDLRIFHTFVFDQDPERVSLTEIGMKLSLGLGDQLSLTFGGDHEHHSGQNCCRAEFVQKTDDEYEAILDGQPFATGCRSRGWASCTGSECSVAVTLRDMWREYPKAIVLDEKGIDIQLMPESAGPLNLRNLWTEWPIRGKTEEELLAHMAESPTAGVSFKGFLGTADVPQNSAEGNEQSMREAKAFAEKHLKDRQVSWGDTDGDPRNNGSGLAKTHELWIDFRAEPHAAHEVEPWARMIDQPPIAPPEPSYMCGTHAMRVLAAREEGVYPEVERGLELMFDKLYLEPVEKCRLYGMIDYGDLPNGHLRNDGVVYRIFQDEPGFKITDLIGWFNNEGLDMCTSLWQCFARTGERKFWALAEANSEHVEDVDTIHAHPTDAHRVGWTHYHSMLHWSGGASPSHTHPHGWLLHYFFTGNRRALEVAREVADAALRRQEPSGIFSNRGGVIRREFTDPVANLWAFYEVTWEEKYGDCARRSLDFFLSTQRESGQFPGDIFTDGERGDRARVSEAEDSGCGMECYMLYDAYRITKDPAIRKAIIAVADWILREKYYLTDMATGNGGITDMSVPAAHLAHAYQLTQDGRYADALREALDQFPDKAQQYADMKARVVFRSPLTTQQFLAAALAVVGD